jgi:hypothetical protein
MGERYGEDRGRAGIGPAETINRFWGVTGAEIRTNNADQLHYTARKLKGMIQAGTITRDNVAAVGSYLGSKYDSEVWNWLEKPAGYSTWKMGFDWNETKALIQAVLAGRMP